MIQNSYRINLKIPPRTNLISGEQANQPAKSHRAQVSPNPQSCGINIQLNPRVHEQRKKKTVTGKKY